MRDFFRDITLALLGLATGIWLGCLIESGPPPESELKSLKHCMQDNQCYMDPAAYLRYYELKHQLENDHE